MLCKLINVYSTAVCCHWQPTKGILCTQVCVHVYVVCVFVCVCVCMCVCVCARARACVCTLLLLCIYEEYIYNNLTIKITACSTIEVV